MNSVQMAIVVAVVENEEGKILAAKRKDSETLNADGKWEFVGGKVEHGEDPEAAVIREVKEESGLDVRVVRLLPKVLSSIWHKTNGDVAHTLLLNYVCRVTGGQLHTKQFDSKISALEFVTAEELLQRDTLAKVPEIIELYMANR